MNSQDAREGMSVVCINEVASDGTLRYKQSYKIWKIVYPFSAILEGVEGIWALFRFEQECKN